MKTLSRTASCLWLAVALTACGQPPAAPSDNAPPAGEQVYETNGVVMDTAEREPELCLGSIQQSLPPQCTGIPIAGWDWAQVDGEETAGGSTWGAFYVLGNYDGETFTVHEAGPTQPFEDTTEADPIDTPCPEPEGGWSAADPTRATQDHVVSAQREASALADFAGLWIDYYDEPPGGPTEEDPGKIILNVAFTGDLERHEQELQEVWGGPLCLTQHDHTLRELEQIQENFPADEFGLQTLWSDIDVKRGVVTMGAVMVDEDTLQKIDERYGEDVVEIEPRLRPVD